jgi:hypothetical protein
MSRILARALLSVSCLAIMLAPKLSAQSSDSVNAPVVLATGMAIPGGRRAMVLMRPRLMPHSIIVVDEGNATPEDVAAALNVVKHLRRSVHGEQQHEIRAFPSSFVPGKNWTTRGRPRFAKALNDLKSAPRQRLLGLGELRTIAIR